MFALLLCVPLLALQGGGPALPQELAEVPEATTAWATLQDEKANAGAKSEAGAVLLQQLEGVAPAERLAFLMEADGSGLLPMDLQPTYRALDLAWPALETRILETLVLPAGENDARLRGAIQAAGDLATDDAPLIEQLANLLGSPAFRSDARASLYALTRMEFNEQEDFEAWWATAKEQGRETWLEEANGILERRELDDWRRRLQAGEPAEILAGVAHPRQQIRSLAYVALRDLNLSNLEPAARQQVADALRNALEQERDAILRTELLALVPQVLQGRKALNPLLRALEFGVPAEREAAARFLQLLDPEIAWEGTLRGLQNSYPAEVEGPSGPIPVRMALWSGLGALVSRGPAPEPAVLEELMVAALAVDNHPGVRGHIYAAMGRFSNPKLLEVLRPIVTDGEATAADRSDALVAMTGIVTLGEDPGQLQALLTGLLADPKPLVRRRAVESMQRLDLSDGPKHLVARLPLEPELVLQKAILSALSEKPTPEVIAQLTAFEPGVNLREAYGRALVAQVEGDFQALKSVHQAMAARGDVDFAFQVVRSFQAEGLEEAQAVELKRLYTVAVSERLLVKGVDNGNSGFANEAVGLLQELRNEEPASLVWPVYLVELQLMRGEIAPALTVMQELAERKDLDVTRKWSLGMDTLRFAAAAKLIGPGRTLLETLEASGAMPASLQTAAETVLPNFPAPEPEPVLPPKVPEQDPPAPSPDPPAGEEPPTSELGGEEPQSAAGADPGPTAGATGEEPPKMVADPL